MRGEKPFFWLLWTSSSWFPCQPTGGSNSQFLRRPPDARPRASRRTATSASARRRSGTTTRGRRATNESTGRPEAPAETAPKPRPGRFFLFSSFLLLFYAPEPVFVSSFLFLFCVLRAGACFCFLFFCFYNTPLE